MMSSHDTVNLHSLVNLVNPVLIKSCQVFQKPLDNEPFLPYFCN